VTKTLLLLQEAPLSLVDGAFWAFEADVDTSSKVLTLAPGIQSSLQRVQPSGSHHVVAFDHSAHSMWSSYSSSRFPFVVFDYYNGFPSAMSAVPKR
jgi:hypothetical protein